MNQSKFSIKRKPKNISIFGFGLIGASLAMAIKRKSGGTLSITGVFRREEAAINAIKLKIVDHAVKHIRNIPTDTDILFLSAGISDNIKILDDLNGLNPGVLVTDVSSTKEIICRKAKSLNLNFIGTHPMAGKELNGIENADPELFMGKPWIVCPDETTNTESLSLIINIIKLSGGRPVVMMPGDHDKCACFASHIPILISQTLVRTVFSRKNLNNIQNIVSSGYESMTRLSYTDPDLIRDIMETNKRNILSGLSGFRRELDILINDIKLKEYEK